MAFRWRADDGPLIVLFGYSHKRQQKKNVAKLDTLWHFIWIRACLGCKGLNIDDSVNATAAQGRCPDGCTNINILAPCLFIMMISVLTATTPGSMATLR